MKKYKMLAEFVSKKETEHWTIWAIESVKFMKEISKVAEKHWFDGYAKWYPREKVDYVPTWKAYEINTIDDITKLTPQQFEFFIDDLRNYCNLMRNVKELKDLWLRVETNDYMTWLDTWLNEEIININIEVSNKI